MWSSMTYIYFVEERVDNGYNYETHNVAVWLDKQKALDFAVNYQLEHLDKIIVEEKQVGVQVHIGTVIYDHTQALFSSMDFYDYDSDLSYDAVLLYTVQEFSPLLTQEVDCTHYIGSSLVMTRKM